MTLDNPYDIISTFVLPILRELSWAGAAGQPVGQVPVALAEQGHGGGEQDERTERRVHVMRTRSYAADRVGSATGVPLVG